MNKKNINLILILKIVFIITCFIFLFKSINFSLFKESFLKINYLISIIFILYIPNLLISTYKWKISLSVKDKSFFYFFKIYWISNFFSNFLPSTIGGDSYKVLKLKKDYGASNVLVSVFLDRLSGLLVILFISVIFSPHLYSLTKNLYLSLIPALILLGLLFVLFLYRLLKKRFSNKIFDFIKNAENILINVKRNTLIKLFFLSFFFVLIGSVSLWAYYFMFGFNLNFINIFFLYTFIQLISMIPISINAIGITEGLLVYFFSFLLVPNGVSLAIGITSRIILFIQTAIGGIIYIFQKD